MLSLFVASVACLSPSLSPMSQEPVEATGTPAASDAAMADVARIAATFALTENYTFHSTSETRGGAPGEGGAERGGEEGRGRGVRGGEGRSDRAGGGRRGFDGGPVQVTGKVAKGRPMHIATGEIQAFKDGDQIVVKDSEGKWSVMEVAEFGRGGDRGGGGQRDGQGGPGDGMRRMRAQRPLMGVSAPHSLFVDFATKVASVKKLRPADEDGTNTYSGTLTKKAAEALAIGGNRGMRTGRGGDEMDTEVSATFTLKVKGGALQMAKFDKETTLQFTEREVKRTSTQTFRFTDVGETEFDVPAEALAHFKL